MCCRKLTWLSDVFSNSGLLADTSALPCGLVPNGGFADVKQRLKNMGCSSPHTKERYPVIQGPLLLLFCCILLPDQPGNLIGEAIDDLHPHAAVYIHAVDKEQEHFIGQLVRSKRPAGHAAGLRQFTVLAL